MLNEEQILDIVRNITLDSFDNDVKNILKNSSIVTYPIFISRLNEYADKLSLKSSIPLLDDIERLQYDLYNVIREIIYYTYGVKYKIHMYLIHAYFNKYSDDAFSYDMISRYNILKYENEKTNQTFLNLCYLFSLFYKQEYRTEYILSELLPKILNRDLVYITDRATLNLYNFYKEW